MILGCPTLDRLGAHWTREMISLDYLNIQFPTVLPPENLSEGVGGGILRLGENAMVDRTFGTEFLVPTTAANPKKTRTNRSPSPT